MLHDFIIRTRAYDSGEYDKCVSDIEVALKGYFKAKDDCEGLCYQMKAQMDRFPQFWRNIAEMEYGSVKCKNDCLDKIAAEGMHKFSNIEHEISQRFFSEQYKS